MHTHEESCIESSIKGLDLVENWLNNVAISHSDSKGTRERYKAYLQLFCTFVGKTPEQIVEEYEGKTSVTDSARATYSQ